MKATRYITSVLKQPGQGESHCAVVLGLEVRGESLRLRVGDQQWALRAIEARRSFVAVDGAAEPLTHVRAAVLSHARAGTANLVVNCGATPPLFTIQAGSDPTVRILAITHHQQNAILEVLERHIGNVGLPEMPGRQFAVEVRPAA